MDSWLIPAEPVTFSAESKKSRFITLLAHTNGVEAAKAFVESVRADHPDARHHCVAGLYVVPKLRFTTAVRQLYDNFTFYALPCEATAAAAAAAALASPR